MAQRYRSARSSSRGGYAPPRKSSAGPTIVAVVVVLVVVVVMIVVMSGQKSKTKTERPSDDVMAHPHAANTPPTTTVPQERPKLPPPPLPDNIRTEVAELAKEAPDLAKQGEAIYDEAIAAKDKGNDQVWEDKLQEAAQVFHQILDRYNDILGEMPTNQDWDEEQVANHYLGQDAETIRRATSRLHDIQKQRRR